jgi:parallel beta-helix repeat protein
VTGNPRDGVAIDSATGVVVNSQVSQNGRMGVGVFNSGSGRIGIDSANNAGGNVISANAVNGVHIVFGSSAVVATNRIMGNGTGNPTGAGINLTSASADIAGGNTISGNTGTGINLRASSAVIGDPNFAPITTVNTVTGNGNPQAQGGISGFLGSSISIRDAVITGNAIAGIVLTTRSSLQIASTTIQNNLATLPGTGDGIRVTLGSALLAQTPNGSITGNAGFGVACTDGESSVVNTVFLGIGPNASGTVSGCTGF